MFFCMQHMAVSLHQFFCWGVCGCAPCRVVAGICNLFRMPGDSSPTRREGHRGIFNAHKLFVTSDVLFNINLMDCTCVDACETPG